MRISPARISALVLLVLSFVVTHAHADGERSSSLQVSPASLTIAVGETARLTTTNSVGSLRVKSSAPAVATVSYANSRISVQGVRAGTAVVTVSDSSSSRNVTRYRFCSLSSIRSTKRLMLGLALSLAGWP